MVGEEKRKEEEMEAWRLRQQVPGIVFFGGGCIIMKAGAARKSTANIKSLRKQLKGHCFSASAQIPDKFFIFLCFHSSFQMMKKYPASPSHARFQRYLAARITCVFQLLSHLPFSRRSEGKLLGQQTTRCRPDYTRIGRDYPHAKRRLSRRACTQRF